jgi:hypothetical protein
VRSLQSRFLMGCWNTGSGIVAAKSVRQTRTFLGLWLRPDDPDDSPIARIHIQLRAI